MPRSEEEVVKANRGPAAGPANRRAILDAAREVYRERGLGAPFSAVARHAGVGQGSLYRHFPTPVALAAAVFEENVAELERLADRPDARLSDLFDSIVDQAAPATAFIELTTSARHDPAVLRLGERFREVVAHLVARESAAARIGAHVQTDDVLLAVSMLASELARTGPADRDDVAVRARAIFRRSFAA